jgi:hypothetical protein
MERRRGRTKYLRVGRWDRTIMGYQNYDIDICSITMHRVEYFGRDRGKRIVSIKPDPIGSYLRLTPVHLVSPVEGWLLHIPTNTVYAILDKSPPYTTYTSIKKTINDLARKHVLGLCEAYANSILDSD